MIRPAILSLLALTACHEPTGRVQDFDSGGGTDRPSIIRGTPGDDILEGTPGDDLISGGAGNDIICGGPCPDRIPRAPRMEGW